MNKYFIIIAIVVLLIVAGGVYRAYFLPEGSKPVETGVIREITIVAHKNEWRFSPEFVEVDRGDTIKLNLVNEDEYDHGIAIDAYGISQRMPANETVHAKFVATQEGDFPFYCSVPCGEGIVEGKKRTHFDMIGKIHVKSIISATQ